MARRSWTLRRGEYAFQDEQGEHTMTRTLREVLEVLVLTVLLFLGARLLVQNYRVDGPSMMPTLYNHEYILVDKALYYVASPHRGDVIVFAFPRDTTQDYVKRVIGVPGDTVSVAQDGSVTVNGDPIQEPYVNDLLNPYLAQTWHLGKNQYFVLGDNRGNSSDSRDWGPVPRNDIIGKASLVYWPLPDLHLLANWASTFSAVPSHP